MTAKDKAAELVERFTSTCRECDYERNAIMFALIAVDEILNINSVDKDYDLSNYWEEVKSELENL